MEQETTVMLVKRWRHARKGIIEGKIVRDHGDSVDIELSNKVRMGFADPMRGEGFRSVHADPGQIIRVRKVLLEHIEGEADGHKTRN